MIKLIGKFLETNANIAGEPYEIGLKFNTTYTKLGLYTLSFYINMYCTQINCSRAKDFIGLDIEKASVSISTKNIKNDI